MPKRNITAAIDIGASLIKTVIVEDAPSDDEMPRIIGAGVSPSSGIRRGAITDIEELSRAVAASVEQAEMMAGVALSDVIVSLGGGSIRTQESKGVIAVGRADGEVSDEDADRALLSAGEVTVPLNYEIIHIIPRSWRLDDQTDIRNPVGMRGVRLEVSAFVVEGFAPQIKNITKCLAATGLSAEEFVFAPIASAEAVLDKKRRDLGCVLIDIGAGSTGIAIYEESDLLHTAVLPIGAAHITNDIAIGIRTSIEAAEQVKRQFGTAFPDEVSADDDIDLAEIDSQEEGIVSRRHIAEIIEARLEEIFEAVNEELKKIDREALLPAGAVLVGGGVHTPGVVDIAKRILRLPVVIGAPSGFSGFLDKADTPESATALGLVKWRYAQRKNNTGGVLSSLGKAGSVFSSILSAAGKVRDWAKKFLP